MQEIIYHLAIDIYPGHRAVASIKVTGSGENKPLIYNVIWNGTTTFNTLIKYTIYKTEENIDASYECEVRQSYVGSDKVFYEECSENNIEQLGTPINTGTINKGEGKTTLKSDEIILTEPEGKIVYYYVIFEYPNEDASQNDDIGSTISGNITVEEGSKYQEPEINLVSATTSGSNGWYKSANITTNITTQTGNYSAKYCDSSCTPNTDATVSGNTFTTSLSSNASSQKICVRVEDEYNQIAEGCSEGYKVDKTVPTVTIASTSLTQNSITITVNGSDSHSGISQYKFSSNNGSSYTYTFTGLSASTTYTIAVQVIDKAGNVSSKVTKSVSTEKNGKTMSEIIAGYNKSTRSTFSSTLTATSTKLVYTTTDWTNKTSYYFAGNPTDNWVYFGGFYWRIIRVNGDGSTRLIYNGTNPIISGIETMTGISQIFNTSAYASYYVGLSYNSTQHGTGIKSDILNSLDSWYSISGLSNTTYSQYIDSSIGFCSDRNTESGYSWSYNNTVYYAAHGRLISNKSPSLVCNSSDILQIPIGLITADEVAFAGGVYGQSNSTYYLFNNQVYWTMSPCNFSSGSAYVFKVALDGNIISYDGVYSQSGVRPVINLKSDTKFDGSGTSTDPFTVVD